MPKYKDLDTLATLTLDMLTAVSKADGTGSYKATLDQLGRTLNPWTYLAAPDGSSDDAARIEAAFTTATVVMLPPGTHLLKSNLIVPGNKVLMGVCRSTTVLQLAYNGDAVDLGYQSRLANLTLQGNGASYTGRGIVCSGNNGGQTGHHLRVLNFTKPCLEFEPVAGGSSSWIDLEIYRYNGASGTGKSAIVCGRGGSGLVTVGTSTTQFTASIATPADCSGSVDSISTDDFPDDFWLEANVKVGTQTVQPKIQSATNNHNGTWTFVLKSALTTTPSVNDPVSVIVDYAVPRKFVHVETGGACSFDFGISNDTFVTGSFFGDLTFPSQSRAVLMTGCRLANQTALTLAGYNHTLVGNDLMAAVTLAAGASQCAVVGNSYPGGATTDNSGLADANILDGMPPISRPYSWTTGGTLAVTGMQGGIITCSHGSQTSLTNFTGGKLNQTVTVRCHANIKFIHAASGGGYRLKGAADTSYLSTNYLITFRCVEATAGAQVWIEETRNW